MTFFFYRAVVVLVLVFSFAPVRSYGLNMEGSRVDWSRIPLHFIPNSVGDDTQVKFFARTSRYTLWLTPGSLVFDTMQQVPDQADGSTDKKKIIRRDVARLHFAAANPLPELQPVDVTGFRVNRFKGDDRSMWLHSLPASAAVLYKNLYQGIDLKVYGMEQQIEYDWIVAPGADPGVIRFMCSGVGRSTIDAQGNLVLETGAGRFIHRRPVSYQQIKDKRVEIRVEYEQVGDNVFVFDIGAYNNQYALIIDPVVLAYSTYLGGSGNDEGRSIAADNQGNVYVTGMTYSTDFPVLDQYMLDPGDMDSDVFITKIDTTRSGSDSLVYSTYLGGSGKDSGTGIAVDDSGNVYITGVTESTDFPILGQYMADLGDNNSDVFVSKLDTTESGSAGLVYSTYLGGSGKDSGSGIAVDDSGNVYVTGETWSTDYPVINEYMADPGDNNSDAFVSKLDTRKSGPASLLYSTYLGGGSGDSGKGVAVDSGGHVYLTGETRSTDFPTVNQYMSDPGDSGSDAFVSKLDTGSSGVAGLLFSTYLGGESIDSGTSIAVDSQGNAYVTGETWSTGFPVVNEYMTDPGDGWGNVFVSKIDTTGSGSATLLFSTYLGGNDSDIGWAIAVDKKGNAYVTGETWSSDFPSRQQLFPCQTGFSTDAFISRINTNGTGTASLLFSSCLGGSDDDFGNSIAVDNQGNVYLTGVTRSSDFPLHNQYMDSGDYHSFITRINMSAFPWAMFLPAILGLK